MKTQLVNKDIKSDYVKNLLIERGLTIEQLPYFLNVPDDKELEDPSLLDNIEDAYQMFCEMIDKDTGHIILLVDSDVDGFTSSTIFYKYFRHFNTEAKIDYLLHEGKGHGLSDTIDDILELDGKDKVDYVIIPDAGSNDIEQHKQLYEHDIKCLILDHHIIDEVDPNSHVIIVNNQSSDNYENKNLCGAGVTWQFCRYCDKKFGTDYADEYIDLAALGIVSDMMSMLSLENRYIVSMGLSHIKNFYFQALCEKQAYSMESKVNPTTVAFYITPLINALIRVGTMDEKQRCFEAFLDGQKMIESHKRGANGAFEMLAVESARECVNARARQNRILDKVVDELEIKINKYDLLSNKVLFIRLDDEDFPSELNGLCAMKLAAKYKRPTIVARLNDEGFDRGSSRGLNDSVLTSFKQFMDKSGCFEYTAGHDNACGISIPDNKLDDFHKWANEQLAGVDLGEKSYSVNFERIAADTDLVDIIEDVANYEDIWGQGNPTPLIHIKDINVEKSDIAVIGKNNDTVRIEKFGITYLKFHAKDMIEELTKYTKIKLEVVGKANMNYYGYNVTPQIFIENYQIDDDTLGF